MKPRAGTRGFARRVPGTALESHAELQTPGRRKWFLKFFAFATEFFGVDPVTLTIVTLRLVHTRGCSSG
jgi:hypothetical protein